MCLRPQVDSFIGIYTRNRLTIQSLPRNPGGTVDNSGSKARRLRRQRRKYVLNLNEDSHLRPETMVIALY